MKTTYQIDLNCDVGESYGNFKIGNDEQLFPLLSSCNIACGFHGGDPLKIEKTIKSALKYNLRIGAHPSYPDLQGFGRRKMAVHGAELKALIKYQIAALKGMVESLEGKVSYVKPHGALYHQLTENQADANSVIDAIQSIDDSLALMGFAGSSLIGWAKNKGITYIAEAFADRTYEANGDLMSRKKTNAVIQSPEKAALQLQNWLEYQKIETPHGWITVPKAQSFCVHGDNPAAYEILRALQIYRL